MQQVRMAAVVGAVLFLVASHARAECAWVLWSHRQYAQGTLDWSNGGIFPTYSQCRAMIQRYTGVAEEGSVADWYMWMRGRGQYSRNEQGRVQIVARAESVLMIINSATTEWRCLPETIDPRRPKGER